MIFVTDSNAGSWYQGKIWEEHREVLQQKFWELVPDPSVFHTKTLDFPDTPFFLRSAHNYFPHAEPDIIDESLFLVAIKFTDGIRKLERIYADMFHMKPKVWIADRIGGIHYAEANGTIHEDFRMFIILTDNTGEVILDRSIPGPARIMEEWDSSYDYGFGEQDDFI